MTNYQNYSQKYEQTRNSKNSKSTKQYLSTSQIKMLGFVPASHDCNQPHNNMGTVVAKLSEKVDSLDIKITSLTNVVKLMQRYTETKDGQYQTEKQEEKFRRSIGDRVSKNSFEGVELDQRIEEFNLINRQMQAQLQNMEEFKLNLTIQSNQKLKNAKQEMKSTKSGLSSEQVQRMQEDLREEFNRKIEICLKYCKEFWQGREKQNNSRSIGSMYDEQINTLQFNINRVENQCLRNRMVVQKQIQESMGNEKRDSSTKYQPSLVNGRPHKSNKSLRALSKSRNEMRKSGVIEHKKIREEDFKEAIRKKRENREKLKVKNW